MDKEKKKLLLVAVSVGVFLVIAISVAVLLIIPKASEDAAFSSYRLTPAGQPPASVDSYDLVRNSDSVLGILPAPVSAANQETGYHIPNTSIPAGTNNTGTNNNENSSQITINVPRPTAAAVPDAATNTQSVRAPVQTTPATTATPAAAPTVAPKPAPASAPTATNAVATTATNTTARPVSTSAAPANIAVNRNRIDYWIQTGSFTAKIKAENVRETLALKGIVSIIENRDIDGKTWYRVRIGPYTSEAEANYWLTLVKTIEGFSESQVWQSPSYR